MATVLSTSYASEVGETAGAVWHALNENGPTSLAKLPKLVGASKDAVIMAVGWLAREDNVWIEERGRTKLVALRAHN